MTTQPDKLEPHKLETLPVARKDKDPALIIYFDGICGFCNAAINFLMKLDAGGKLVYAPLQGETAQRFLPLSDVKNLKTLIVTLDGQIYRRSAAVVRILWQLGGYWSVLGTFLWIIPAPLRDLGYRLFARFRYRLFGTLDACRMPQPGERDRFLP